MKRSTKHVNLLIEDCEDCPHLDYEYPHFKAECRLLERVIPYSGQDFPIPDDCPLDDVED